MIKDERHISRVKLDEMSTRLEKSQNEAHEAAEDHREALMALRSQKNEVDLNIVRLKCDMHALQAERDSLKQENGILRETPDSEDKEYTRLKSELAKEMGNASK